MDRVKEILVTTVLFTIVTILPGCFSGSSEKPKATPIDYKLLSQVSDCVRDGYKKLRRHHPVEARKLGEEAVHLLEKNKCTLSIEYGEAWVLLGKVAVSEKKWDVAASYYGKAMPIQVEGKLSASAFKLSEEAYDLGGIPKKYVAGNLNFLANRYAAMELRDQINYTFLCIDAVGDLHTARGKHSEAVSQFRKNADFLKENQKEPSLSLVRSLEKLSKSLKAAGNKSEAAKVLEESKEIDKKWHEATKRRRKKVDGLMNWLK